MAETLYQKRTKVRRMSDIDRLAQQFSRNIESTTSEYEKSFADYQKQRAALMRPYEAKVRAYNASMATYETQAATYASKLKEYQKALEDFPTSEGTKIGSTQTFGRSGTGIYIDGQFYRAEDLPANYYGKPVYETRIGQPSRHSPAAPYQALVRTDIYKRTPPAPFTEKAPVAPEAPTAPDLPEFDASQFEAKRKELGKTFQREVSERKAARFNVVGRRGSRPLLQET